MTAVAYPNRTRAATLGTLLSQFAPLLLNCFFSWLQTLMERLNRHLAKCMLDNEQKARREQWERANALARLKAMTNGGSARAAPYSSIPQAQQSTILHEQLEQGDLAWVRVKETGRVFDGLVRKRHPVDGWTEFEYKQSSLTFLDVQFELLARVSVAPRTQEETHD